MNGISDTNTHDALNTVRTSLFRLSGNKRGVLRTVVLFTDGDVDDTQLTLNEASRLRMAGITVLVVALGDWVKKTVVEQIASDPRRANVFFIPSDGDPEEVMANLLEAVCDSENIFKIFY